MLVIAEEPHKVCVVVFNDDVKVIVGAELTVTSPAEALLEQPVTPSVNVIFAVPATTPVTKPALVIVATAELLLVHVPPVDGSKLIVLPSHTVLLVTTVIIGAELTVISPAVALLEQPVVPSVNTIFAVPAKIPVTKPVLVIVATAELLLVHVPPVDGSILIVFPSHTIPPEGIFTVGDETTAITSVEVFVQGAEPTV